MNFMKILVIAVYFMEIPSTLPASKLVLNVKWLQTFLPTKLNYEGRSSTWSSRMITKGASSIWLKTYEWRETHRIRWMGGHSCLDYHCCLVYIVRLVQVACLDNNKPIRTPWKKLCVNLLDEQETYKKDNRCSISSWFPFLKKLFSFSWEIFQCMFIVFTWTRNFANCVILSHRVACDET